MESTFLKQVNQIIHENIDDHNFGANQLASTIGLSTSQTLRKLKSETGKTVNQYIQELRLKKAASIMADSDLTISEIAYMVGFNSPSYFNKSFYKQFGVTPGKFNSALDKSAISPNNTTENKIKGRILKPAIILSSIITIVFLAYLNVQKPNKESSNKSNSIAVLPFDNMSPHSENEWLGDGITEDILANLSLFEDLRIISRTSTSHYKESDKIIPDIAKELGVYYILEGSVRVENKKMLITAQLINAEDEHIWSSQYEGTLDNILDIQSEISQKIAENLNLIINPSKIYKFDSNLYKNPKAYELFVKGNVCMDKFTNEGNKQAIEYYKQAIVIDSNYADAMANLAYAIAWYSDPELTKDQSHAKAWEIAEKAIKIDSSCSQAYAVNGLKYYWENKQDLLHESLKKALELEPNNLIAHKVYTWFYLFPLKDKELGLYHAREAYLIDPLSQEVNLNYINALIRNDEIDAALNFFSEKKYLLSKHAKRIISEELIESKGRLIGKKKKDYSQTIIEYERALDSVQDTLTGYLTYVLARAYKCYLNDDKNYLLYAKKASQINPKNVVWMSSYVMALIDNELYEKAQNLMNSSNYLKLMNANRRFKIDNLLYYYYEKKEFDKVLSITKDSLRGRNSKFYELLASAQMGNFKDSLFNVDIFNPISNTEKAIVFSIQGNKDSMYSYLNQEDIDFMLINSRKEFDKFRLDKPFINWQRKHYLPVAVN